VRVELRNTTTDLLFLAMKEFGKKAADQDPRCYELRIRSGTTAAGEFILADGTDSGTGPTL
jgi:hypothetical protein